ncbi:MAG: hypothetical protein P4K83_06565 [Terracidiphilus sp.]|nr:hypothetical protein [Terracidiphilus sp.]
MHISIFRDSEIHRSTAAGWSLSRLCPALLFVVGVAVASAGGPKFVAGSSYFNPAAMGTPVHWRNGVVNYYVDQGQLSSTVTNAQATAMVDAAAALWSNVATAAVVLTDKGPLNEDVSGANIQVSSSSITAPADATASATNYPLAVIYDADGAVIDALYGTYTSEPDNCSQNGVYIRLDNVNPDATIAHATMILNGRCTGSAQLLQMMSFNIARAFGRVLGLDYAQINPTALTSVVTGGTQGWPIMQPSDGLCSSAGGACIPLPSELHWDDIAALNRIYPVTNANIGNFTGKKLTASNTVSFSGAIQFRSGYGMQGVNIVARPLDAGGNPLYQYTVATVSGALFRGMHGNAISGALDASGIPYTHWGSTDSSLQGNFDLSAIPLPPGVTSAAYQISFETLDSLDINDASVGPYTAGQSAPSGTLANLTTPVLSAGDSKSYTIAVEDSAKGGYNDAISAEAQPRALAASGYWVGRLSQVSQSDWFLFAARGGRTFSIVAQALDESGRPSDVKAMPMIGAWDANDAVGSAPVTYSSARNGLAPGESWLRVSTTSDSLVRIAVADKRGDGRPDYSYAGWVLYADTIEPDRLPATGGAFAIHGMGFRETDTVLVGGQAALITSISPNLITAIAPAAASNAAGSVDVEVDDDPIYNAAAIVTDGISYDAGTGDALTLVTAPENTVPTATPLPFAVIALDAHLKPASNVQITYSVLSGTATLGCGSASCTVTATGDGQATMNVTATDATWSSVTATLANGSAIKAEFVGGTAAKITALSSSLSVAAGATVSWPVQALVLANGAPAANQTVTWQTSTSGIAPQDSTASATAANGIATKTLTVGPLAEGQQAALKACVNGTSNCTTITAFGARPEYALLQAVSGTTQTIGPTDTPTALVFRLLDTDGNPMAGGTVTLSQALYARTNACSAHTICTAGALLSMQSSAATSALDGTVSFSPASLPGVATTLHALAASGSTATVAATVERRP